MKLSSGVDGRHHVDRKADMDTPQFHTVRMITNEHNNVIIIDLAVGLLIGMAEKGFLRRICLNYEKELVLGRAGERTSSESLVKE